MPRSSSHYTIPFQTIDLMLDIAAHFGGDSTIDPWLHDPALLRQASFAKKRVGLVPQESLWRQLVGEEPQLELRHANVFQDDIGEQFDIVLWGPFWRETVNWRGRRHCVEAFLLDRALELLAPGGTAFCLVPPNVLTAPLWRSSRQRIVSDFCLAMTIELPCEPFAAGHIRSTIVVVRKDAPTKSVFMSKYRANHQSLFDDFQNRSGDFHIAAEDIHDRWDRNYHDPRARAAVAQHLEGFTVRKIGDLGEVFSGRIRPQEFPRDESGHLLITGATLKSGRLGADGTAVYVRVPDDPRFVQHVLRPGDILVSANQPRVYIYGDSDPPAVAGNSILVIRSTENDYLAAYLATDDGQSLFAAQVDMKGSKLGHSTRLTADQLRQFRIPIIRLSQPELLTPQNLATASRDELEWLSAELLAARREALQLRHRLEQEQARHADADARAFEAEQRRQQSGVTQAFIEKHFAAVNEQLCHLSSSVEQVHQVVQSIRNEFASAKNSARNIEEKIVRMRASLDRVAAQFSANDCYQIYTGIGRSWLDDWDRLQPNSQIFLASAEHLFDVLTEAGSSDLSPFVLQYCRALENELLQRIFIPYHDDFHSRIATVDAFLSADLELDSVRPFARAIKKDNRDHTIGAMARILGMARPGGNTVTSSPLLSDF